eukprot:gnl/MRDRNA2_/MRDRNA2_148851_c0_seq1.p1 gnl/MRDRNA2_/MRDRNA2_148851_c0~~gnl/MRDRNA2_/MRDRNA2_148851_c0_seq1.p1  ORF type:complete len:490 (-),score=75.18 gnl/MRDRNA2_/MRDRNA2_148851_c0_seq1:199-1668(-)
MENPIMVTEVPEQEEMENPSMVQMESNSTEKEKSTQRSDNRFKLTDKILARFFMDGALEKSMVHGKALDNVKELIYSKVYEALVKNRLPAYLADMKNSMTHLVGNPAGVHPTDCSGVILAGLIDKVEDMSQLAEGNAMVRFSPPLQFTRFKSCETQVPGFQVKLSSKDKVAAGLKALRKYPSESLQRTNAARQKKRETQINTLEEYIPMIADEVYAHKNGFNRFLSELVSASGSTKAQLAMKSASVFLGSMGPMELADQIQNNLGRKLTDISTLTWSNDIPVQDLFTQLQVREVEATTLAGQAAADIARIQECHSKFQNSMKKGCARSERKQGWQETYGDDMDTKIKDFSHKLVATIGVMLKTRKFKEQFKNLIVDFFSWLTRSALNPSLPEPTITIMTQSTSEPVSLASSSLEESTASLFVQMGADVAVEVDKALSIRDMQGSQTLGRDFEFCASQMCGNDPCDECVWLFLGWIACFWCCCNNREMCL